MIPDPLEEPLPVFDEGGARPVPPESDSSVGVLLFDPLPDMVWLPLPPAGVLDPQAASPTRTPTFNQVLTIVDNAHLRLPDAAGGSA